MTRCPDCGKFAVLRERDVVHTIESHGAFHVCHGLRYYYHCPRCKKDFRAVICGHCGGPMPEKPEDEITSAVEPDPTVRTTLEKGPQATTKGILQWPPFWWLLACVICLLSGLLLGRWIA